MAAPLRRDEPLVGEVVEELMDLKPVDYNNLVEKLFTEWLESAFRK